MTTTTAIIELNGTKYTLTHSYYQGYSLKNETTGEFKFVGQYLYPAENKLKALVKETQTDQVRLWVDEGETFMSIPKDVFLNVFESIGTSCGTFSSMMWIVTGRGENAL